VSLLDDHAQPNLAQLKFVPVFKWMGQIGCQSLTIEKGPVGASQVLDEVVSPAIPDLAMAARNPSLKPTIWREINVWEDPVRGVETPNMNLFGSRELDLTTRG
jgi:hypothetical protein